MIGGRGPAKGLRGRGSGTGEPGEDGKLVATGRLQLRLGADRPFRLAKSGCAGLGRLLSSPQRR